MLKVALDVRLLIVFYYLGRYRELMNIHSAKRKMQTSRPPDLRIVDRENKSLYWKGGGGVMAYCAVGKLDVTI
jgi:hypothetical protein